MDDFTREIFDIAREELPRRQRRDVRTLIVEAEKTYVYWRDASIGQHANELLTCERDDKQYRRLLKLCPKVCDMMLEHNPTGEWYIASAYYPDHAVEMAAWAIAILRWIHRDRNGLVPHLKYTEAEIVTWLDDSRTYQMSMFSEVAV